MENQDNFFGRQHLRLLNIATWAKNAAWMALAVYILAAGAQLIGMFTNANGEPATSLTGMWITNPLEVIRLGIGMLGTVFRGIVYYLVLRGIYLGLTMIVETDINYREQRRESEAGAQ